MAPNDSDDEGMLYDARMFYARIIGLYMKELFEHCESKNYTKWLDTMDSLFSVIGGRIKKENKKEVDYPTLRKEIILAANKHPTEYFRKTKDATGVDELDSVFLKTQSYLYDAMQTAGIFGYRREEGL